MNSFLRLAVLAIGIGLVYSSIKFMIKSKRQDFAMLFSGLFVLLLAIVF